MDLRKVKTLIDLVQQSDITELEITEGEERVRISRGHAVTAAAPVVMQQPVILPAGPAAEHPPHRQRRPGLAGPRLHRHETGAHAEPRPPRRGRRARDELLRHVARMHAVTGERAHRPLPAAERAL